MGACHMCGDWVGIVLGDCVVYLVVKVVQDHLYTKP